MSSGGDELKEFAACGIEQMYPKLYFAFDFDFGIIFLANNYSFHLNVLELFVYTEMIPDFILHVPCGMKDSIWKDLYKVLTNIALIFPA